MNKVCFNIYLCGMSTETFTKEIMIYKPHKSITRTFCVESFDELEVRFISDLINHMKTDTMVREVLGEWGMENFNFQTTYIKQNDYLLGLKVDKPISEIFSYLGEDQISFAYFVVGGASIHNESQYRFTVHSDEKNHEHMPHVHVSKAGVEIRYSLESFEPIDPLINPHKRDKKIIAEFLGKNQAKLFEFWNHNINGYYTPDISEDGNQFYSES